MPLVCLDVWDAGHRRALTAVAAGAMWVAGWAGALHAQSVAVHKGAAVTTTAMRVDDPVADPKAVVVAGNARFTVLTPEMVRMEWAADGRFEDHASFVFLNRRLSVPAFTHSIERSGGGERMTLRTSALELSYAPHEGTDGRFTPENLSVTFTLNGTKCTWHPGMTDSANLMGTTRTLDGNVGDKTKEPIEPGLVSRDGWTVVDDSARPLFDSADFRFQRGEQSPWPWVMLRPTGERQDWYFFGYGHDYKRALGDYIRVAGRIPLPPRFAFGAWWSRYWAYSDGEIRDLVHSFRANDVPLDVLVIDMDWHVPVQQLQGKVDQSGQRLGWTGYTWNKTLFPDPPQFLHEMHEDGLKLTLNMHPASGVQPWEERYAEMARASGIDPATNKYVAFDITSKRFAANYMNILHHPLEKQGIDFWWLDWQQQSNTALSGVNPTWWLNYVHFTDQEREGKRPLLFHRWGGLGNHRYQIGFSGDTISGWDTLAFQPWFTATAANVGYAYWSHDIGGHIPGTVDPELYTRWVQFGTFSPILRTHTTKNPDAERRIWAYPEPYSEVMRDAFHLRYALEPYIYTEARRTYDSGVAFVRPLYYDWPEADEAYAAKDEYVFGDNMIVAPVTTPVDKETELATEPVWIPAGVWIEWPTGRHLTGPMKVESRFSIDQVPVYVRAGAIVPMQPEMRFTGEKAVDPLIVNVFPMADGQRSTYRMYEDSSKGESYKEGECAWTEMDARRAGATLELEVKPVRGSYPGMPKERGYELRLPGDWPPSAVRVNGRPVAYHAEGKGPGWRYQGETLTTVISLPRFRTSEAVHVTVERRPELVARDAELNGFAGKIARLRMAVNSLNHSWPKTVLPEELIHALQTGDRLTYFPGTAGEELDAFDAAYRTSLAQVKRVADEGGNASPVGARKATAAESKIEEERERRLKDLSRRAVTQMEDAAGNER